MTAAQKKARDNFKKAIEYRKKTGCSLKQAFAAVKGGTVKGLDKVVKKSNKTAVIYSKKAAPKKKVAPKKKAVKQGSLFGVQSETKEIFNAINNIEENILKLQNTIERNKKQSKLFQYQTPFWKKRFSDKEKMIKKYISELKKHRSELKKLI